MGTISTQSGYVDYTIDIANVVNAINSLTSAVATLNATLTDTNVALRQSSLEADSRLEAISTSIGSLNLTVSTISTALTDATKGIYTQKVDLPYQSVYQRAMMKSTFNITELANLQRAVQEETQATVFTHA